MTGKDPLHVGLFNEDGVVCLGLCNEVDVKDFMAALDLIRSDAKANVNDTPDDGPDAKLAESRIPEYEGKKGKDGKELHRAGGGGDDDKVLQESGWLFVEL